MDRLLARRSDSADTETHLPKYAGDGEGGDLRESGGIQTTDAQSGVVLAALTESVRRFCVHRVAHVLKEVDSVKNAPDIYRVLLSKKRDAVTNSVPIVLKIGVGGIGDEGDRARLAGFEKTLLRHLEEGTDAIGSVFHLLDGSHTCQSRNSTSTIQTHEECLNLVVSMVSNNNLLCVIGFADLMQQSVALLSSLIFELCLRGFATGKTLLGITLPMNGLPSQSSL